MKTSSLPQDLPENNYYDKIFLIVAISVIIAINAECYIARNELSFNKLISQIHIVDGDKLQSSNLYVHYYTENMNYSGIKDSLLGFSHKCGLLKRKVQYCQWVEREHSRKVTTKNNKSNIEFYYTYEKYWLNSPKSSEFYHNIIYMNPKIDTIDSYSHRNAKIQAGAYFISSNMILKGDRILFVPSDLEIEQMKANNKNSDFVYAGRGVFYSPYKRTFFDDLLRFVQFFDLYGERNDWCIPGDRRIWFESYEPKNATVIGLINGNKIEPFRYNDKTIGSVQSGKIKFNDSLEIQSLFDHNSIYIIPSIFMCYFFATFFLECPDLCVTAYLLFCTFLGYFATYYIFDSDFTGIILSIICGFCSIFIRFEEANKFTEIVMKFWNEYNANSCGKEEYKKLIKRNNNIDDNNDIDININSNDNISTFKNYDSLNVEVGNSDNDHDTIVNNSDSGDITNTNINNLNET